MIIIQNKLKQSLNSIDTLCPDYNSEYQMYNNNRQQYPEDDNNQQFHGDNNNPQYPGEYSEEDFYQNNMEEVRSRLQDD